MLGYLSGAAFGVICCCCLLSFVPMILYMILAFGGAALRAGSRGGSGSK